MVAMNAGNLCLLGILIVVTNLSLMFLWRLFKRFWTKRFGTRSPAKAEYCVSGCGRLVAITTSIPPHLMEPPLLSNSLLHRRQHGGRTVGQEAGNNTSPYCLSPIFPERQTPKKDLRGNTTSKLHPAGIRPTNLEDSDMFLLVSEDLKSLLKRNNMEQITEQAEEGAEEDRYEGESEDSNEDESSEEEEDSEESGREEEGCPNLRVMRDISLC